MGRNSPAQHTRASRPAPTLAWMGEARVVRLINRLALLVCLVALSSVASADSPSLQRPSRSSPPVADAGPDRAARTFDIVTIDGSASHDTASNADEVTSGLVRFEWRIVEAPAGSVATLDSASPETRLVPDRPGNYVVELIVT